MNWYRNRTTATKLLTASALMAALMGVVGYRGLATAGTLKAAIDELYKKQMLGSAPVYRMQTLLPTVGDLEPLAGATDARAGGFLRGFCSELREHFYASY
jgi:hypothetical protein